MPNLLLEKAIADARILQAYAAEAGVSVAPEIVRTVIDAGAAAEQGGLPPEQEAAFWAALNTLATAVAPVTVDSLRATTAPESVSRNMLGRERKDKSLARQAVEAYTLLAIGTLLVLLTIQVYWIFGTSITEILQPRLVAQAAAAKAPDAAPKAGNEAEIETLRLKKEVHYALLRSWMGPWLSFLPQAEKTDDEVRDTMKRNNAMLQPALILLDVLQRYILPMLYGLLGTCVYVLRTLSTRIQNRTYSEAANIGFRIRIYLGMLGGVVFAWFVIPESADGLFKTLSPFALAFLAGYGIELLFAAMDRLIAAFTGRSAA